MNITKEEVQRLIEAFHADPHTADWDDALSLLRAKRDEKDAEPVAWIAKQEDGGLLLWDASYKLIQEGYDLGFNKNSRRLKYYPLYTHPAHDDTALLRQALEALKELWDNFGVVCPSADLIDQYEAAITALRERLGEKA